jgi:hypothetical protein
MLENIVASGYMVDYETRTHQNPKNLFRLQRRQVTAHADSGSRT